MMTQAEIEALMTTKYDLPCYVYLRSPNNCKILELNSETCKQFGIPVLSSNEVDDSVMNKVLKQKEIQVLLCESNKNDMIKKIAIRSKTEIGDYPRVDYNTLIDKSDRDYCKKILEQYPEYTI